MSCYTTWATRQDPERHAFFARMLLEPGWAGQLNDKEVTYIQQALAEDRKLSSRWGLPPRWKNRPAEMIRRVAQDGDPLNYHHNRDLTRRASP